MRTNVFTVVFMFVLLSLMVSIVYARDFAVVNLTTVLINASGGANTVAIATGAFTNVSIGTDAPAAKLHVRGDVLIDNKSKVESTTWDDVVGSPATMGTVFSLVVYNGTIFAGSGDGTNNGDVWRYDGGTSWTNISGSTPFNGIVRVLVVYNGQLYAAGDDDNVFRYDGGTSWTDVTGTPATILDILSAVVYNGQLYIGSVDGNVWRYNGTGTTAWFDAVTSPSTLGDNVNTLVVYNGQLYAAGGDDNVWRYDGGTSWTDVTGTPATISPAAGAIENSAVYNGQLYVSYLDGIINGGVFRYDGGTSWTNVTGTVVGLLRFLTVYNGQLFILEVNGNGVFRYDGGTSWTDVTTTSIGDGNSMVVYNGSLYAGSFNGNVYRYTANPVQSYALKFKSGEGNEIASLWFQGNMSSGQSIEGQQQHGQFIFSHGIQTQTGAYDIAEEFPTWDYSIEAGDIVVASYSGNELIEKSNSPYQKNLIGVVSTKPAVVLRSDQTGEMELVSLAGRVPIKVSTENGAIAVGDFITSSSIAGVGMKATQPGRVIGKALENFDPENGIGDIIACPQQTESSCGRVKVLVRTTWYYPDTYSVQSLDSDSTVIDLGKEGRTVVLDEDESINLGDESLIEKLLRVLSSVFAWLKGGKV